MNRWLASSAIALACCGIVHAQSTQPTTQVATKPAAVPTDVPVVAVKLFSSGVGYFERVGTVHDEDHAVLRFKTDQINDILKSLVLQDLDGGTAGAITYPSQDPVEKTLAGYSIDISSNQSLLDLLTQLRGAHLTLSFGPEKLTGVLLSTESKQFPGSDDKHPITSESLTLLSGTSIRSIPLDGVRDIQLDDPQLQKDLTAALETLAGARNHDQMPLDIAFHGHGDRHVRIGYVVEAPVWKTSYRLVMDDDKTDSKPHLQGWAMVENPSDTDWKNVQLSLVSGRPISFIENLYSPIYLTRPTVQPNLYGGLQPTIDTGGELGDLGGSRGTMKVHAMGLAMNANAESPQQLDIPAASQPLNPLASIVAMASTASLGELFSYNIADVTLHRHESAMLPIVNSPIDAQRVSVYNEQTLPRNPLNGVRLKNTTDNHLLQGPVTVFEHGSYAGDAQLDHLPPTQSRLLTYGIDLKMSVDAEGRNRVQSLESAKIANGVLLATRQNLWTHDFKIDNRSNELRTLIIEEPVANGMTLVDTPKPIETTGTENRFQLDVPAHQSTTFTVKQRQDIGQRIEILPANADSLVEYISSSAIPKSVQEALRKAVDLKSAVTTTEASITADDDRLKSITDEQTRIRNNMKAVDPKSDYYTRLMKKLNEQETTIEQIQSTNTTLHSQLTDQTKALNDYIATLTIG